MPPPHNKLLAGDRLLRIGDIDVSCMTLLELSKVMAEAPEPVAMQFRRDYARTKAANSRMVDEQRKIIQQYAMHQQSIKDDIKKMELANEKQIRKETKTYLDLADVQALESIVGVSAQCTTNTTTTTPLAGAGNQSRRSCEGLKGWAYRREGDWVLGFKYGYRVGRGRGGRFKRTRTKLPLGAAAAAAAVAAVAAGTADMGSGSKVLSNEGPAGPGRARGAAMPVAHKRNGRRRKKAALR
jgi:hypothetical protein